MMMKKIFIYMAFLLLASACNQMDDIYDDLDESAAPYSKAITYTFTSDDYSTVSYAALANAKNAVDSMYARAVKSDQAFNDSVTAADYVGDILADGFVALDFGSMAQVSYNFISKAGETDLENTLLAYETATSYKVSTEDYASVGGIVEDNESFFPSETAEDNLPAILLAGIPAATDGDVAVVAYNYSAQEPGTVAEPEVTGYSYDFDGIGDKIDLVDQFGWSEARTVGDRGWQFREYSDNGYLQFSAFGAGEAVTTYLISPVMNVVSGSQLTFDSKYGYFNGAVVEVLISTDYAGDVATATWSDLTSQVTFSTETASGYGEFLSSGAIDLSSYAGTVNVAFKYSGSDPDLTTTFQLDNFVVGVVADKSTELATAESFNAIYMFDGTEWAVDADAIVLNDADYDAMGTPGKYNNFSDDDPSSDYLPQFLMQTQPYAKEGDAIITVYLYYKDKNNIFAADYYTYTDGQWSLSSASDGNLEVLTSPFFRGTAGWILDPTVRFSIAKSDYQAAVDWVKNNVEDGASLIYKGNSEYYYGFSAFYINVDTRVIKRTDFNVPLTQAEMDKYGITVWTDDTEQATALIFDRLQNEGIPLILSLKYPDAQTQVFGADQTYEVTFVTYENDLAKNWYTYKYACTKSGPDPEFTFVEELEVQ